MTEGSDGSAVVTNYGGQYPVEVGAIVRVESVDDILEGIRLARETGRRLSIMGTGHSQGGHTRYPDGLVLQMEDFDEIVELDPAGRTITVESGITWEEIQARITVEGLSLLATQTSNIFSVGGSLSANIHGRSTHTPIVIDSVEAFELALSDGALVRVTPESELFHAAIGGYGLLGAITEVTFRLTEDHVLTQNVAAMPVAEVVPFVLGEVIGVEDVEFLHIDLSLSSDRFLEDAIVKYLVRARADREPGDLMEPSRGLTEFYAKSFITNLSRRYEWAMNVRWRIQEYLETSADGEAVSRNNYMGPVHDMFFLDYTSDELTDFIQEYYVPLDGYETFVRQVREIVRVHDVRVIDASSRYVSRHEAALSYARQDSLSLMLTVNTGLDDESMERLGEATREIVDAALDARGTYYLTYQLFPSKEQLLAAYPRWEAFVQLKRRYDPSGLFNNVFFERYEPGFGR